MRRSPRIILAILFILAFALIVGTAWHEVVGHGLTAVAFGARLTYVEILGMQIHPEIRWLGWTGYYGECLHTGLDSPTANAVVALAGSLSTWLVAVAANVALWLRRWRGLPRTGLVAFSIWWIDLLTYTLPTFGIRRSILWGGSYSEPYEAAVELGIPGWCFQAFAVGSSAILAFALARRLRRATIVR